MNDYLTRVGAYGLIVENGHILLCRISPEYTQWAGQWTLPGGGLEFAEQPVAGMQREVEEETGLLVEPGDLVFADATHGEFSGGKFHSIRLVYRAQVTGGEMRFEVGGSTDRCEWIPEHALAGITIVDLVRDSLPHAFGS